MRISDGRTLWLFGDSHINTFDPETQTVPCLFQSRNAAIVQQKGRFDGAVTLVGPGPGFRSWLRREPVNDPWFWPLWGYEYRTNLFLYLGELRQKGTGTFGFERTGHDYFARVSLPDLTVTEYLPLPDFGKHQFGTGFIHEKDGYTYTYGTEGSKAGNELRVARFRREQPLTSWRFWDGKAWSTNIQESKPIMTNWIFSTSVYKIKNKYVWIGSALSVKCDMGREIYVATADRPTGPFSKPKAIYSIDDALDGHYPFFYFPLAHPEFINRQNELLITYSINGYDPCVATCVNNRLNPDHYRPRAIRVPLKLIDPEID
jgi:hypothetical protein